MSAPSARQGGPKMIIDCAPYQGGRRQGDGAVPLEEAAARCGQGGLVWLGRFEPGPEELALVRDTFGLHELAVEDAQTFHIRPKVENYDGDVRLVILRTARYDDEAEEVEFGEISVFLAPTFVITVRQGVASELRGARQRLEQRPEVLSAGSTAALWALLGQVVDGDAPVVARHGAGGQHGGDLGRADEGQCPAERHHRAAHDPGNGLLAADVRHWLLRPELRVARWSHTRLRRVPRLRHRRSRRTAGAAVLVAETPQPARR